MLKSLEYRYLILFSIVLGLAPFVPEPHLTEKINMLIDGTLTRPIDIFDLVMHSTPIVLLIIKYLSEKIINKD
ncbi:MAG: hypothetical protein AB7E76_10340 [Deferribacterales bacterium]